MNKQMIGYILIGLGGLIAGISIFNIPLANIIGILIGGTIGFAGYKLRLYYRN